MKLFLQIILFCLAMPCLAQPTGHAKVFLEITDHEETLDFKRCFNINKYGSKNRLIYDNYQLIDVSKNHTGFECYPNREYIHKTLMTDDHELVLVKNKKDTMRIQLFNAYNVYFLSIPFQEGDFRLYVNDGREHKWAVNTLPYKKLNNEQTVYNLTPIDWSAFQVSADKTPSDYFVETQFKIQGLLAQSVLPEDDPNFKNPRRINHLRLEVEDYNFDGKKDYREQKWKNNKEWNYFIYTDTTRGYVLDTALSKMNIVAFDFEKKNFKVQNASSNNNRVDAYQFVNGQPTLIPINNGKKNETNPNNPIVTRERLRSIKTYEVNPFRFELEQNCSGVELPKIEGFYANKISVYDQTGKAMLYTTVAVGNEKKESAGCGDSLQIADYNFDGSPDFRICNNSVPGKHTYYIYHPQRQTFIIEQSLSELTGLQFDFLNKIATGYSGRKQAVNHAVVGSKQFYSEQLRFEGAALQNLTVTSTYEPSMMATTSTCKYIKQKRIYEGDTIGLKLLNKKPLVKKMKQFKFELIFNPEEVKTSGEKGAYASHLTIYFQDKKSGPYEIHGNYFHEVPHWQDSLEIADYNFDGYPDIRVYNSQAHIGTYHYMVFNPSPGVNAFYMESLFSGLMESEFIPQEKILKGKIVEPTQTLYLFFKNDTLTLSKQEQDQKKSPFIEESIYKYGERRVLRAAYNQLDPILKKENGDFNFDGHEDFRQQSKASPYYWDVFVFNPKKNAYEKDTLLSGMEWFDYNRLDKTLDGYSRKRLDETTWQTLYYQWSFAEKKMVCYKEKVCYSKYPMSESTRCIIREWINGKWIETQQFGAE